MRLQIVVVILSLCAQLGFGAETFLQLKKGDSPSFSIPQIFAGKADGKFGLQKSYRVESEKFPNVKEYAGLRLVYNDDKKVFSIIISTADYLVAQRFQIGRKFKSIDLGPLNNMSHIPDVYNYFFTDIEGANQLDLMKGSGPVVYFLTVDTYEGVITRISIGSIDYGD